MVEHPHSGEDARRIADEGVILLVQVGSGVHGTSITGQDDRDEMGICLEPASFVTGLARVVTPAGQRIPFEQYEMHTAWERPGGLAERSGAGDLDIVVYGARKWAALAAAGNPTVLLPLWVPDSEVVRIEEPGRQLRRNAERFVSKKVGARFLGYLSSQKLAMTEVGGGRAVRPAHVGQHGYDVKYAMHALRLGMQGAELLRTGQISLPVPEPYLSELRAVRSDQWPLPRVLDRLATIEDDLNALTQDNGLPDQPDWAWINEWLHTAYQDRWTRSGERDS